MSGDSVTPKGSRQTGSTPSVVGSDGFESLSPDYGISLINYVLEDIMRIYTFQQYQEVAWSTAIFPNKGKDLIYPVLKLNGESGEVAEKLGKIIRDKESYVSMEDKRALVDELGDVLWYINAIAITLGVDLEDVAQRNIEKLESRKDRNVLHGEGDYR